MKKILIVLFCTSIYANAETNSQNIKLTKAFCYTIQASGSCNNLQVRMDTGDKVNNIVGSKVQDQNSPYYKYCKSAILEAANTSDEEACDKVWRDYGCNGKKYHGLIQQSSSNNQNAQLCQFKG